MLTWDNFENNNCSALIILVCEELMSSDTGMSQVPVGLQYNCM